MMMLEWKDGRCTNPPPPPSGSVPTSRWEISVTLGPGWSWLAGLVHDDAEFGVWCPRSYHEEGYGAESAAQLACEAALMRLGVLPLPAWRQDGAMTGVWHLVPPNDTGCPCRAQVWLDSAGSWRFDTAGVYRSRHFETVAEAKAAAERHLRAELAAWLDAQAAKEEA